jgi:hypothetical protein
MYPAGIFFIIEGFDMRLNKISLAALALGGSMLLSACGGGNDSPLRPTSTVTTPTTVGINGAGNGPTVVSSVLNQNFSFDVGVSVLGTTAPTTLTLSGSATAPSFSLTSGADTATGVMTYGSCIFTIVASTFPAGSPLALGNKTEVNPCTLSVATAGSTANGTATPTNVSFVLGATASNPVPLSVSISPTGVVTVGGVVVGSATVVVTTGAGN